MWPEPLVLDAGALVAVARGRADLRDTVGLARRGRVRLVTSGAVVAQVWCGGPRQARLAALLGSGLVEERALDGAAGRRVGELAARQGQADVVDGHVALLAADLHAAVLTSDVDDLLAWGVSRSRLRGV